MANNIIDSPLQLDTQTADITVYQFKVTKIRWVGATAAGHKAIVANALGVIKFSAEASGANYTESEHFDPPLVFAGLTVSQLDSGVLYLYVSSEVPIKQ